MSENEIEKVVGMHDLLFETSDGWQVVERVEYDEAITFTDTVVPPAQPGCSSYPQSITRSEIGRAVAFRVRKSGDGLIATLNAKVAELAEKLRAAEKREKDAAEHLTIERREHSYTKSRLEEANTASKRARDERDQVEASKRKLETDLDKVREHIGRKAFEEIIPPEKKSDGK